MSTVVINSARLFSKVSRASSSRLRGSRVVAVESPSCMSLLYSKMCSTTSCFPNKIRKNRDQNPHPTAQANPLTKPLHTHSPSCSRHCLQRAARSWGQGWPGACEGPPGGLGLDAGEDGATLSKPGAGRRLRSETKQDHQSRQYRMIIEQDQDSTSDCWPGRSRSRSAKGLITLNGAVAR